MDATRTAIRKLLTESALPGGRDLTDEELHLLGWYTEGDDYESFDWQAYDAVPTVQIVNLLGHSVEDLEKWLADETGEARETDPDRVLDWEDALEFPVREPLILIDEDGDWGIWDGSHRLAAAAVSGRKTVPAIVGTLK